MSKSRCCIPLRCGSWFHTRHHTWRLILCPLPHSICCHSNRYMSIRHHHIPLPCGFYLHIRPRISPLTLAVWYNIYSHPSLYMSSSLHYHTPFYCAFSLHTRPHNTPLIPNLHPYTQAHSYPCSTPHIHNCSRYSLHCASYSLLTLPHMGLFRPVTEQDNYSIDMIALGRGIGLEYDGDDSHQDPSKDKRRRNELNALGWNIFPIDKNVLYDPAATERLAYQLAKAMGVRLRKPRSWETKYVKLRMDLGLPV